MKTRMASALAAASLAGVAVIASGAPASALYPPTDSPPGGVISDPTPAPGQAVAVAAGARSFAPLMKKTNASRGCTGAVAAPT